MDLSKQVSDIMSTAITAVSPDTSIKELDKLFVRRAIHHIPVEDKKGIILGIVSTEDLSRYQLVPSPVALSAQHIMTPNPVRLAPDIPIGEALTIFLDNRFRALPVVNSVDKLVGIVTPYDFLELILNESAV